jgi:hypothetical protein
MARHDPSRRDAGDMRSEDAGVPSDDTAPRRVETVESATPGRMWVPRSRGAITGILLILLGLWGALVPFVGPYFSFSFVPDETWVWTSGRGWLEVLPGAMTVVGGALLLLSTNRAVASLGAWLAVLGGVWFIVGPVLAPVLHTGDTGSPTATRPAIAAVQQLAFFEGIGAAILFLGAVAVGRLSLRSQRDVQRAQTHSAY